jgi:pimeloyl-ACP methyl ester carboxylesterase
VFGPIVYRVRRAQFLGRAGYSTLLIDFQGTGESAGEAITFGWRERFDVIAAVQYLKARLPGQPVAIIAISLGGAATLLARSSLGLHGVVLEAVYPSIDRALKNRLRMRIGPLGSAVAPLILVQLRSQLGIAATDLKPVEQIGGIRMSSVAYWRYIRPAHDCRGHRGTVCSGSGTERTLANPECRSCRLSGVCR